MRYETIHDLQIPKLGFGTWRIGGDQHPNPDLDDISRSALRSALEMGYRHFDTAEIYGGGHSEELLGETIQETGINREELFITSKVSPDHLKHDDVLRACENSLRRLQMDYIDLYLIHWPRVGMNLPDTFNALNRLVREGRVRHLGVSNFNLRLLKQSVALSETPLITDQVPYCIPGREYVKNGVLEYCQQHDILLTAYTPIQHRFIQSNKTLHHLAQEKSVTPQQIALAWLTSQNRVITIPMSFNPIHQAENLAAANLVLTPSEMALFD